MLLATHRAHGLAHLLHVFPHKPLLFLRILGLMDFFHACLHLLRIHLHLRHGIVGLRAGRFFRSA